MKLILLITAVSTIASIYASPSSLDEAWVKFKLDHGKQYLGDESARKAVFTENFNKIQAHNKLYDQGLVKYYLKINQYSDLTSEEMRSTFNGFAKSVEVRDVIMGNFVPDETVEVPDEIDWREKGAVTDIKNETSCYSSWAFSAVAALEAIHFLKSGELVSLSEQNLMDCSRDYSTKGCKGGDFLRAFIYVSENDGIDSDESYPYEAVDRYECYYKDEFNVTSTSGFLMIESGNEEHLKAAVGTVGPVSVAIDGERDEFASYGGGIFYLEECVSTLLSRAVLIVGYGSEDGEDYWIVKNSVGTSWGEEGYIRMARNRDNNCGIATYAAFPLNY